jgi:hypothetical protein
LSILFIFRVLVNSHPIGFVLWNGSLIVHHFTEIPWESTIVLPFRGRTVVIFTWATPIATKSPLSGNGCVHNDVHWFC